MPFDGDNHTLVAEPAMFFDLFMDPYQLQNLAGTAQPNDIARDLDARLRQWDKATPWMEA